MLMLASPLFFYSSQKTCFGCSNSPVSKETFLLTTDTTHDTRSILNFLFGRPSFSFQSYDTATSPSFCLTKDEKDDRAA